MKTLLSLLKHLLIPSAQSPRGPYHRHGDPPGDHVHADDTQDAIASRPQSRVIWSYNGGAEQADTSADPLDTCDGYEAC